MRITEPGGSSLHLVSGRYRAIDGHGFPDTSKISECCSLRSGLYHTGENTVIINDVQPGLLYEFSGVGKDGALQIDGSDLIRADQPVIMLELNLGADSQAGNSSQPVGTP